MKFPLNINTVPIFIGTIPKNMGKYLKIRLLTKQKPYIFTHKKNKFSDFFANYKYLPQSNPEISLMCLEDFSASLDEYLTPILIINSKKHLKLTDKHLQQLEPHFIILSCKDV